MKARVLRVATVLAVVFAFTAVAAHAQGIEKYQKFVVPFQFSVGEKVLPAGEYTVTAESQTVRIQSKDGKQNVIALPIASGRSAKALRQPKLTFKYYGDRYVLAQIWLSDGLGRELKRQRTADDVAQNVAIVEITSIGQ